MTEKIQGAGGLFGGGGGRQPYKAPDTLESKQFATVFDLVSEGEIEGFSTPSKKGIAKTATHYTTSALSDVFLDDTPVFAVATDSSDYLSKAIDPKQSDFNFQDVTFKTRFGTASQDAVSGVTASESSNQITSPVEVTHKNPDDSVSDGIARFISDDNAIDSSSRVDAIKLTINFPQLQRFEDNGDILGSTVELKIQLAYYGGSNGTGTLNYATVIGSDADFDPDDEDSPNEVISGRSRDLYQKEYLINLDGNNNFTRVYVRIVRKTDDVAQADEEKFQDKFFLAGLTKVFFDKRKYENCAYQALRLSSEQFRRIPKRAYRIRGIKVRIPGVSAVSVSANFAYSANTVTITTSADHNLRNGDFITVSDGNGAIDGFNPIETISGNQFKYTVTANNPSSTINGTCTYRITPNVDLADGRINYPFGYVFGGTMGPATWTSCPSMILLDLLTNERYGFGAFLDPNNTFTSSGTSTSLDIQSFVAASRYSNEVVDGEARFSCNVNIQNSNDAYSLINELAGVMRCMPIWSAGTLTITQDKPADATFLFNLANVTEAGFSYSGASSKQRHTVIKVSYFDNETREIDYAVYGLDSDDPVQTERINKFGIIEKQVKAFGCTSEKQAIRLAKAIVFAEEEESEIVTFSTSLDAGSIVRPGTVIEINDPVKSLQRTGGRVKSIDDTNTILTLDDTTSLISELTGSNQQISVVMSDGTVETKSIDVSVSLDLQINNPLQVKVTSGFTDTTTKKVNPNAVWLAQSTGLQPQKFRIVTIEEQDGVNYAISAVKYNDGKYDNIEQGIELQPRNISILNRPPQPPSSLTADERLVSIRNKAVNFLNVSWPTVNGVSEYTVQYRYGRVNTTTGNIAQGNWVTQNVFRPDFTIENSQQGRYEFRVYSLSALRIPSATFAKLVFNAVGKSAVPANVSGLFFEPVDDKNIRLRWNRSEDADVVHGGFVYIKHNSKTDGSGTWNNSANLIDAIAGNSTEVVVPAFDGEYLLKFADDGGRFSKQAISVLITKPDTIPKKIADIHEEEDTNFSGSKTGVTVFQTNKLKLTSNNTTGVYTFASDVDLGADYPVSIDRILTVVGVIDNQNITQLITGPPDGVTWENYALDGNFAGPSADNVEAKLSVGIKPNGGSQFAPSQVFSSGIFTGRFFRFFLELVSTDPDQNINIIEAGYKLTFDQRIESTDRDASGTALVTANGVKDVTFLSPFFAGASGFTGGTYLPSVGVSVLGLQFAETVEVSNISRTGFRITIKDKNNNTASVARNFSYTASGFGKGV